VVFGEAGDAQRECELVNGTRAVTPAPAEIGLADDAVLEFVAGAAHQAAHAFGPERRHDAGGAAANRSPSEGNSILTASMNCAGRGKVMP